MKPPKFFIAIIILLVIALLIAVFS